MFYGLNWVEYNGIVVVDNDDNERIKLNSIDRKWDFKTYGMLMPDGPFSGVFYTWTERGADAFQTCKCWVHNV